MATWRLKGCPRCGGDVIVDRDESQCLQCGFDRLEPSEFALAFQKARWEPPMDETDGRGGWDRGSKGEPPSEKPDRNRQIRKLREEGVLQKEIGRRYRLTQATISLIVRGLR